MQRIGHRLALCRVIFHGLTAGRVLFSSTNPVTLRIIRSVFSFGKLKRKIPLHYKNCKSKGICLVKSKFLVDDFDGISSVNGMEYHCGNGESGQQAHHNQV